MRNRPRGGTAPVPVPYRPVLFSPSCKALALFSRPVLIVSELWCARDSRHIRRGQFCTPRGKLGNLFAPARRAPVAHYLLLPPEPQVLSPDGDRTILLV